MQLIERLKEETLKKLIELVDYSIPNINNSTGKEVYSDTATTSWLSTYE